MKEKITALENDIIENKNLYYQGKPKITDEEYDLLELELKKIDPENPVLSLVGQTVFSGEKIQHETKMLSLNKSYKVDDLIKWASDYEIVSTYKIDGSSCSLIYNSGVLSLAKTRGDGKFGENITPKVLSIKSVPKSLKNLSNVEVRGEIFIKEKNFSLLSEEMKARGLEAPNNMRNIVAGILGRKENIDLAKYLSFQAFELFSDMQLTTEEEKLQQLSDNGFDVPEFKIHTSQKSIQDIVNQAQEFMSKGDYLIDGLVFTINNLDAHAELGETAHHPKYKMAFKYQGDVKNSEIKSISWQVSRNGILTPVGNIKPIDISGAMISRVTLHNFGMVEKNQLKAGDIISIVRSGEVIPKFLNVLSSSKGEFKYPKECPSCSSPTRIEDIRLYCDNQLCPDKIKEDILNFIKKIGIDDLSSKRLEELIKHKYIVDIPSLFKLTENQLLQMDKVKEKLASKILKNISSVKKVELPVFLSSLGISGGAINKCEKVVENGFDTIEKILSMTSEDLEKIESFAQKSSEDFVNSIKEKRKVIEELISLGVDIIKPKEKSSKGLSGLKFCITGTLSMKRGDLQKLVKDNGGEAMSSVTSKTNYLITNDVESSSSKFTKAKELNIPIINEAVFLGMIK